MVLFTTFRAVKAVGRFQQKRFGITSSGASGEWTLLVHVSREAVRAHHSKSNIVSELGVLLCETRSYMIVIHVSCGGSSSRFR
jgi:hypothetical protein